MPRVNVPVNRGSRNSGRLDITSIAEVVGDAVNNHTIVNDGKTVVHVHNTSGDTARVVTFHTSHGTDGLASPAFTESIPFGKTYRYGPYPTADYGTSLL